METAAAHTVLEQSSVFGELLNSEARTYLLDRGRVKTLMPGDVICRQNDRSEHIYILLMGEAQVSEDVDGQYVRVGILKEGELFGEIAAMYKIPRISTVTASRPSVVVEIPASALETLFRQHGKLQQAVIERTGQRIVETTLKNIPAFRPIKSEGILQLSQGAALVCYSAGQTIVTENEPGDTLSVICRGVARVGYREGEKYHDLALLQTGEYFGERSILTGAPRAASVMAVTNVEVVQIDRGSFLRFIQDNPGVRDSLDMTSYNRFAKRSDSESETPLSSDVYVSGDELKSISH